MRTYTRSILLLVLAFTLIGCAGTKTFHEVARVGDTVAIPAGWKHHFSKDDLIITITPNGSSPMVYTAGEAVGPGDPTIRVVTNMYLDPLSSMVVSRQTNQNLTPFSIDYANSTANVFTSGDKDMWQTAIFIDLPTTLEDSSPYPTGLTEITVANSQGESVTLNLNIVAGAGTAHDFAAQFLPLGLTQDQLSSLARVAHYTLSFSGSEVPAAVELELTHTNGVGQAYVVNPLGHIKNAAWSDDGTNLKVILMRQPQPSDGVATNLPQMQDLKFYVAGGITGLKFAANNDTELLGATAFDENGQPVAGVNVTITQ